MAEFLQRQKTHAQYPRSQFYEEFPCSRDKFNTMEVVYDREESKERTFVLIKPDGIQRGFVGRIIRRFEEKGLNLLNLKMIWASEEKMIQHSIHLKTRPFFKSYIKYMISGPVILMVWEGTNAIKAGRLLIGETFPQDCSPKMIRGEYSLYVRRGIIHGSDSIEAANEEIKLWFGDEPLKEVN